MIRNNQGFFLIINFNKYLCLFLLLAFGIGVLAGFDYYIAEDLFLGVEIAYGVGYTKESKTTFENEDDHDFDYELKNGSAYGISPSLTTANLRLGWLF